MHEKDEIAPAQTSTARLDAAQLLNVERWRTLGTMVPSLVHGLSNPNGIILFNADLLARLWPEIEAVLEAHAESNPEFKIGRLGHQEMKSELRALVAGIRDASQRVGEVLASVRDYARAATEPESEFLDLNDVVRGILTVGRHWFERHTEDVRVELAPALPRVRGSRAQLAQVLLILIQNACASLPDRRRFVRIRTAVVSNHSRVSLIVEDDGRGLPAEGMGRLGQEPHLTDDQQAGLGLWIANCIAELHRGELTLGGREGGGTRATLTLPVARLEAE